MVAYLAQAKQDLEKMAVRGCSILFANTLPVLVELTLGLGLENIVLFLLMRVQFYFVDFASLAASPLRI